MDGATLAALSAVVASMLAGLYGLNRRVGRLEGKVDALAEDLRLIKQRLIGAGSEDSEG